MLSATLLLLASPAFAPLPAQEAQAPADLAGDDAALAACREFIDQQNVDRTNPSWKTNLTQPPQFTFSADSQYFWKLETDKGEILIRFMPDVAPMHVSSTIYLTELGYYDSLLFHRVIPTFMAQGGCPLGTGGGNPGYTYGGEFDDNVKHDRGGLLSMANRGKGDPTSDGSQFFITFGPTPHLDNIHTIFGEVVRGMDALRALEAAGQMSGSPKEKLSIQKASIAVYESGHFKAESAVVELPSSDDSDDAALEAMAKFIGTVTVDQSLQGWKTDLPKPPQVEFTEGTDYFWNLRTNKGPIRIRLMPDVAPMHVSSTIYLTRLGFYDDVVFHRVITGFMAQGGCPNGTGRGSPGYSYEGEFDGNVRHDRPGLLSMANAGPGTDGSQFFLTFVPTPHLDNKHTIFGEVVAGMSTVKLLEAYGSPGGRPIGPLKIEQATIHVEKADAAEQIGG